MLVVIALIAFVGWYVVGRRQKAAGPATHPGVGESIPRAPGDYLETVVLKVPSKARRTINLSSLQNEIRQFRAIEERYPASLAELAEWRREPGFAA